MSITTSYRHGLLHSYLPNVPRTRGGSSSGRRPVSSGFEIKNWRVHRLGCPYGIKIFAQECDLAACCPQEHHILLAIAPPRRLDARLRLDFGDGHVWIGAGIHRQVEEAE